MPPVITTTALAGLLVGSFLNVVVWRLPRGESLVRPGSRCPSCETPIRPYENIPVLSWLFLRGRCRTCAVAISARYPAVEAATAALCALVQAVARLELEEGHAPGRLVAAGELLAENRFLAARDGIEADLLDPEAELRRPARALLRALLDAARPHADDLGCRAELETVARLALEPPFLRQLDAVERRGGRLPGLMAELAAAFAPEA